MTEPTSHFFERRYVSLDAGGALSDSTAAVIDVSRRQLIVNVPPEGWHLLSDEQIDGIFAAARRLAHNAAPFWLRARHVAGDDAPAWLRARYESALAAGSLDALIASAACSDLDALLHGAEVSHVTPATAAGRDPGASDAAGDAVTRGFE